MPLEVTAPSLSAASATAKSQDLGKKDIFLKLLVAQMKNQDPLKPQDPTQMSSQLAQFNMVEQQTNTNKLLEQIAASGGVGGASTGLNASSASYLGRTVTVNQNSIQYNGGTVNFSASLPNNAASVQATIVDGSGRTIRNLDLGAMASGHQMMSWDGLENNGVAAPLGTYSVLLQATDAQGKAMAVGAQRSGIVDAVRLASGKVQLMVGGIPASLADVTEIRL